MKPTTFEPRLKFLKFGFRLIFGIKFGNIISHNVSHNIISSSKYNVSHNFLCFWPGKRDAKHVKPWKGYYWNALKEILAEKIKDD